MADDTAWSGTATPPNVAYVSVNAPGSPRRRLRPDSATMDPPAADPISGEIASIAGAANTMTTSESLE